MPLTTIDGQLCIPSQEYGHFTTFLGLQETALTEGRWLTIKREAEDVLGAKTRVYSGQSGPNSWWSASYSQLSYLPDEWLIKTAYACIQSATDTGAYCQPGEEDIDGNVWSIPEDAIRVSPLLDYYLDSAGILRRSGWPDLALIGPASLGGKIVLEMCRRLARYCCMDDAASRYHRNIPFSSFSASTPEEK